MDLQQKPITAEIKSSRTSLYIGHTHALIGTVKRTPAKTTISFWKWTRSKWKSIARKKTTKANGSVTCTLKVTAGENSWRITAKDPERRTESALVIRV
jgi:hypothetical protein